jgi:AraC-like DNA-binding protein
MRFDTYIPSDILKPYIKRFIVSEQVNESTYKILPDTSLVIGFQYKGRLKLIGEQTETPLATAGITGLGDTFKIFNNTGNIGTILVFFSETGASHFFDIPLHEIFSHSLSLDTFIKKSALDVVEEQLAEALTDIERIVVIEQFLISQFRFSTEDKLVAEAINIIKTSSGNLRIADLASRLCISQSPFEKRFRKIVGATPKKFSKIIRIQSLINNKASNTSLTSLGYTAGYFDQSHFIKDFKSFTGETPEEFFSK